MIEIRATRSGYMDGIEFYFYNIDPKTPDIITMASEIKFKSFKRGEYQEPAKLFVPYGDKNKLIGLADDLWGLGIRPSMAKGSAGQLEAVNKHLQDMRYMAFKGKLP